MIFETFQLDIRDIEKDRRSILLKPKDEQKTVALKAERRKIYIVYDGKMILYVGEAKTSINTRLQRGLSSYNYFVEHKTGRNGYKGYKWLDPKKNDKISLTLHVVIFDEKYDENRNEVEAIEGELVYEIRNKTGRWVEWQNEIHFSNIEGANEKAKEILAAFGL